MIPEQPAKRESQTGTRPELQAAEKKRFMGILDPVERISEVWFGLVMVLTFTCSLSVRSAGRIEVRSMLIAALGCNVAWGIIDAFMYLLSSFVQNGRGISALRELRATTDAEVARRVIADALPPVLASSLTAAAAAEMREHLNRLGELPKRPRLTRDDWLGGAGIFLLTFLSTFPVALPFAFINHAEHALRVSNGVALAMLFLAGYAFGRYANYRPWRMGLWMILVGAALVVITIRLGG